MRVDQLAGWVRGHRQTFIASLLDGSFEPSPVRGVSIPKPGGGERQLGIPTVIDRLVQQAFLQVLTPILDPTFSPNSYGFRPGKSAHDALAAAKEHVAEGHTTVVDIDLEKFVAGQSPIPAPFDRVNHDVLMNRLGRHVGDKRMLRIIGRFLRAGLMQNGVCTERKKARRKAGRSPRCWPT